MQHTPHDFRDVLAGSAVHTFQHGGGFRGDFGSEVFQRFGHENLSEKKPRPYRRGEPMRLESWRGVADLSGLPAAKNKKAQRDEAPGKKRALRTLREEVEAGISGCLFLLAAEVVRQSLYLAVSGVAFTIFDAENGVVCDAGLTCNAA